MNGTKKKQKLEAYKAKAKVENEAKDKVEVEEKVDAEEKCEAEEKYAT